MSTAGATPAEELGADGMLPGVAAVSTGACPEDGADEGFPVALEAAAADEELFLDL